MVGGNITFDELHIQIKESSLKEIEEICDKLNENDDIYAMFDTWMTTTSSVVINDLWAVTDDKELSYVDWTNPFSSASNWSAVAIDALGAWKYEDYFESINIGIVDDGFTTTNPDLDLRIASNTNTLADHGTHVAGIVGATANNEKGITGIVWNKTVFAYDAKESTNDSDKMSDSDIYEGIETLVKQGCKVINLSLGKSGILNNSTSKQSEKFIKTEGKTASNKMAKLLEEGYDFIIVQAADNGAKDGRGVDAINSGLFCSITEENCTTNISADDIMSRIIIVANAMRDFDNNTYICAQSSNGGTQVHIAAPGSPVLSTVTSSEYPYEIMGGTSQAAPMVTGVASLVWSVNENFTGAEVKEIVCKTAEDGGIIVKDNPDSPTTGSFYLLNAKLAVEEAINRTHKIGSISGVVKDKKTNEPIEGVKIYTTVDEKEHSVLSDANGSFKIELPENKYELVFESNGYLTEKVNTSCKEKIETVLMDTVYLTPSTYLMGTVIDKETNKPIEDAKVLLKKVDDGGMTVDEYDCLTDENGQFTVSVPVGTYEYSISNIKYEESTGTVEVNKADGNIMGNVYLIPKPTAKVFGTVQDKATNEAIPYVTITLINSDNVPVWTDITDTNGEFVFDEKIPYGTYTIQFTHEDYTTNEYTIVIDSEEVEITELLTKGDARQIIDSGECGADGDNVTWVLYEDGELVISGSGEMHNYVYIDSYGVPVPWRSKINSIISVTIEGGVTSIGDNVFADCVSLASVIICNSVTSIGTQAFMHCDSLASVIIGNSVTRIGYNAFKDCYSLTRIIIPNSVTSIVAGAFRKCYNLANITIPNSVTSIGDSAFYSCDSLSSIIIPDSVTSIGDSAFYSCDSLSSIIIPDSVTSICDYVFYNCDSLASITIPNSVTSIGSYAFRDCDSLASITIPDSVTSICDYAFDNCDSLTDVYYTGTQEEWEAISIGDFNEDLLNATIRYNS